MLTDKADEDAAAAIMMNHPHSSGQQAQGPRTSHTPAPTEESFDPLPYQRPDLMAQHQQQQQQQGGYLPQHNNNNIYYDPTRYQGASHSDRQAPWTLQQTAGPLHKTTNVENRNDNPGFMEPSPIWPNVNHINNAAREVSFANNNSDDPNPIPIQPRYPPIPQKQYELGPSATGLHIPKQQPQQQQQWRSFPTSRRTGESAADSFQGRPFYPPQQQQQQQQPLPPPQPQAQPIAPNHPNLFHLTNAAFQAQQAQQQQLPPYPTRPVVEKVLRRMPSRGTTPIPTFFGDHQTRGTQPRKAGAQKAPTKTRKRPWHRRSVPALSDSQNTDSTTNDKVTTERNHSYIWRVNEMLEEAPLKGFEDVVSWQSHGRAFKIHKPTEFCQKILPRYFDTTKLAHFRRWLGAWGFCQHREGVDRDAFYHRYFVRGVVVSLLAGKSRTELLEAMKGWVGPGEVPDFESGKNPSIPKVENERITNDQEEDMDNNQIKSSSKIPKNPKRLRGTLLENLRQMLDDAETKGFQNVVSWLPGGRAFKVHNTQEFQSTICAIYFQTNLLRSFSDSLRTWGFCRLWEANGTEKNAYYHRLFQHNMPHLCRHYSRAQMLDAMKDFREEQKRQKEISWSLFPRHREEQQQQQQQQEKRDNNNLSDDDDSGDEADIGIDDEGEANPKDDYLIPYLEMPNRDNRNGNSNTVDDDEDDDMDTNLRPSAFGENYGMEDPDYQIVPPTNNKLKQNSSNGQNDNTRKPIQEKSERQTGLSYAIRINRMLEDMETKGQEHICSWMPHGRAFRIHDEAAFEKEILPLYFSATSLASFSRWLNKWGFLRIRQGKDRRAWYHRLFVRGVIDLLKGLTQKDMFAAMEEWRAPGKEPDFYCSGKGNELSELTTQSPNKKPKTETNTIESNRQPDNTTEEPSLLQPTKDPKFLRGTLVEKLREMLDVVQAEGNESIVSWLPHGKAFKIHSPKAFAESILHRFFGVAKYRYFGDVLRSWGFVVFKSGRDKGAFYHKCFVRDKPRLCLHLSRTQLKASMKDWPKGSAPDLYQPIRDDSIMPDIKQDLLGTSSIEEIAAPQTL